MKGIESDPALSGFRPDLASIQLPSKRPPEKKKAGGKSGFMALFDSATQAQDVELPEDSEKLYAQLEGLMDQIHQLGDELVRHPGRETIQQYRQLLKRLIQAFIEKGLRTEKQLSNRNILQQKSYQMIKIVDEKLEKLVVGILQSQFNQIEILAKVEEIQGLLVNLLH